MSNRNVKVFDPKQPGETLDYDANFTNWLTDRADAIASYTVTASGGITVAGHEQIGGVIRVAVSGGTDRSRGKVTVRVTTVGPPVRVVEADLIVPIVES